MVKFKNLEEIEGYLGAAVSIDELSDGFSKEAYNVWALNNELTEVFVGSGEGSFMTPGEARRHVKDITKRYRRGAFRLPRKYVRQIVEKVAGIYIR